MHMNTPISPLVYSSNFGMNLKQVTFIKKINENLYETTTSFKICNVVYEIKLSNIGKSRRKV